MPIVQLLHRKIREGKFAIPPEYDGEIPPGIGLSHIEFIFAINFPQDNTRSATYLVAMVNRLA